MVKNRDLRQFLKHQLFFILQVCAYVASFNKWAKPLGCKAHIKIQDWSQSDKFKEIISVSVNVNFLSFSCRNIFILSKHPISMAS